MNNYNPYKTQSLDDYKQAGEGLSPLGTDEKKQLPPEWSETIAREVDDLREILQLLEDAVFEVLPDGDGYPVKDEDRVIAAFCSAAEALRYVQVERELAYESLYLATAQAAYDSIAHKANSPDEPLVKVANDAYDMVVSHFVGERGYNGRKQLRFLLGK